MKTVITAAFLSFGVAIGFGSQSAVAGSLNHLESACRTGDFAACSEYNAAVIARNSGQSGVLTQGYDPFAIVPASHAERTPKAPSGAAGTESVGKTGVTASVVQVNQ